MQTRQLNLKVIGTLIILLLTTAVNFADAQNVNDSTESSRSNSSIQRKKPYIILISGDGFRYDYAEKYQAKNLLQLSSAGVRAKYMIPSYPSVTHPNHYAIVSGLYPAHSGIVGNSFYDPVRKQFYKGSDGSWFGGEPIWITAERQEMLTANFNWVNAGAIIKNRQASYQFKKGKRQQITLTDRITAIKNWLTLPEDKRPHLITMYFYDTDHTGHAHGPDASETAQAVHEIDEAIGQIVAAVKETGLPVNFIFVSDHGMMNIDKEHPLPIPAAVDTSQFVINNQNSLINLYAKDPAVITSVYNKLKRNEDSIYKVYLNASFPAQLHYGGKDDLHKRAGDIILVPVWPKTFHPKPGNGVHGFSPYLHTEMGATFLAWGPAFKKDISIEPFENVEIYNVMTSILGLKPAPNDGKGTLAKKILK